MVEASHFPVKAALWKKCSSRGLTHKWHVRSCPSVKDCPFVILKNMGSWKIIYIYICIFFFSAKKPLTSTGQYYGQISLLHIIVLGRITLSWTLVRVVELEKEHIICFPNLLVIHKESEQNREEAAQPPDVRS